MLDKLTYTFKKHFYYFLENFGFLKCFIAFLDEFCSPMFRKCYSRQYSMATREFLGQHLIVYYKVLLAYKYFKHCAVSIINDKSHWMPHYQLAVYFSGLSHETSHLHVGWPTWVCCWVGITEYIRQSMFFIHQHCYNILFTYFG